MNSKVEVVRKTQNVVFYNIPAFSFITNEFLDNFEWPTGIKTIGFISTGACDSADFGHILGDKYAPRWTYSKDLEKTEVTAVSHRSKSKLVPGELRDFDQLKRLYIDSHLPFYEVWKEKLDPAYMKGIDAVAERFLPSAKALYLEKEGEAAGLLTLVRWEDCHGVPVDWILWVWLRDNLMAEEKHSARGHIADWLRKNAEGRVQCAIDSFNVRSQRFFLKLGFSRQCLYVIKAN